MKLNSKLKTKENKKRFQVLTQKTIPGIDDYLYNQYGTSRYKYK